MESRGSGSFMAKVDSLLCPNPDFFSGFLVNFFFTIYYEKNWWVMMIEKIILIKKLISYSQTVTGLHLQRSLKITYMLFVSNYELVCEICTCL